jgi:putative DNA primase/helicase
MDNTLKRGQSFLDEMAFKRNAPAVNLIPGTSIKPEPIDWLWNGWLAAGKLHVMAGAPGTGKTTVAIALAATVTTGGRWPDGTRANSGNVLIWSGEDDPTDTLAPRLLACEANMSRVFFVGTVADADGHRAFDPSRDMQGLADAARRVGNVRLLVVDPVVSAVTGDSHKNSEVRRALQPLVDLGHELGTAILGISHFAKGSAGRDPTERVAGSLAFGALARVVLATAKMQDEAGKRILARSKSNIGLDDGGFYYDIEQIELAAHPGVWASRVLWGEVIEGSAREILASADAVTEQDDAPEDDNYVDAWLRDLLTEAGEATKVEIMRAARNSGHSERTVQRARKRIGAHVSVKGFGADKHAVWSMHANRANNRDIHATPQNCGTNGTNGTTEDEYSFAPVIPKDSRRTGGRTIEGECSIAPIVPMNSGCTSGGTNDQAIVEGVL